ncbi:hypothetical protein HFK18_13110|uniref:hypothetical protein n=1 Tax=Stenotrophomonas sp. SbOxS2 TaxID=2723885 RepID=UPI0015D2B48D|nr:hypothetical protein [Stenotrophomonas sp. SbOxS2]NYT99416.1 hypothetical protein [Stenotrophomonas sp. SbOxS2]
MLVSPTDTPRSMSLPPDSAATTLAQQLDSLARQGQRLLDRAAVRRARQRGLRWALAGCAVLPLLALATAHWLPVPVWAWALAGMAVVALLALAPRWSLRARRQPQRRAALALLDRRAGAEDRLLAADEFLAAAQRDGFREAAIADAQSWVALAREAAASEIVVRAPPLERWRRAMPVAAIVLLAAAAFVPGQGSLVVQPKSSDADAVAAGNDVAGRGAALQPAAPTGTNTRSVNQPGAGGAVGEQPSSAASGAVNTDREGGTPSGEAGTSSSAAATQAGDGAASSAGEGRQQAARPAPATGDGGQSPAATPQHAKDKVLSDREAPLGNGDSDGIPDASTQTPERPSSAQAAQSALPPSSGAPPPSQPQSGKDPGQPPRQSPSEKGDQGQSQGGGQENGQGQGQGQGTENALKRTRGLTGLLLGVPMEDQLTGTPNRGRVRSITRPGEPKNDPAAASASSTRGSQSGDSGASTPRPASAADQQLVRDYFLLQRKRGDSATKE